LKNKAIFLDRDGTIIMPGDHNYQIEDMKFTSFAIEGLKAMNGLCYKKIILTNQAGIAKGIYTIKDYYSFRSELNQRFGKNGIIIDAEYFCPHHVDGTVKRYKIDCNCRKPKTGMLEKAAEEFNLDLRQCWMIGDNESDILTGKNAGCKTIQVMTGEAKIPSEKANFVAKNLLEANYFIT
jgi:D,D-heptose 1,7-bisphosphate phosphatase